MKKALIFSLLIILLISCQAQKEKLELNLTKGETYTQKLTTSASVIQTVNGQKINMDMTVNGNTTYKIIDIRDSIYELEVMYNNISMQMNTPMGNIEFNSSKNDKSDLFSSMLGAMISKPFFVKMTKTGRVIEVTNLESIFSSIFEIVPDLTESQKQQVMNQFSQSFGEEAFTGNLEAWSAIFPGHPVTKGDKWNMKTTIKSGTSANVETTYELKEINDAYCLISGNSKIVTADKDAIVQSNGRSVKFDISGTMTSEIKINRKTGWVIESRNKQSIKGTNQLLNDPGIPGGMTIPMEIKSETTVSGK